MMHDIANKKIQKKAKDFVNNQLEKRLLNDQTQNLLKRNLDQLNIPIQIENMFPEKVQIYEQMRMMEHEINDFMQ